MSELNLKSQELAGQTAVVTGSSSGIGRAIALALAEAGASVLVHAGKNSQGAAEVAAAIASCDGRSKVVLADLADPATHEHLIDEAWNWAPVDIWVNNAGADVLTGAAAEWSFEQKLEQLWRVDVLATIQLSRLVGQRMQARGQGVILNMGWDQASTGQEGSSGEMFAATKGAIQCFTQSLAKSLAPEVRVNCLAPGWIKTAWGEAASDYWQTRAANESLLARWGSPQDVARVACFLASPAASYLTGQTICINGGRR